MLVGSIYIEEQSSDHKYPRGKYYDGYFLHIPSSRTPGSNIPLTLPLNECIGRVCHFLMSLRFWSLTWLGSWQENKYFPSGLQDFVHSGLALFLTQLLELALSFYNVGPGDWIYVIRLVGRLMYLRPLASHGFISVSVFWLVIPSAGQVAFTFL